MRCSRLTYSPMVMIGWAEVFDSDNDLIYVVPIDQLPHLPTLGAKVCVSTHGNSERAIKREFKLRHGNDGTFLYPRRRPTPPNVEAEQEPPPTP